ncbi:unnamed protein product [Arctogadus glacialis]
MLVSSPGLAQTTLAPVWNGPDGGGCSSSSHTAVLRPRVAHHDPDNTFNCSFIEPAPSASGDQEPLLLVLPGVLLLLSGAETKHRIRERGQGEARGPGQPGRRGGVHVPKGGGPLQARGSEQPLLKSSDSEGSTSGSESAVGRCNARIARLSKTSKEDDGGGGGGGGGGEAGPRTGDTTPVPEAKPTSSHPPSPGKPKPPPTGPPPPNPRPSRCPGRKKRSSSDGSAKSEERQRMRDLAKEKSREQAAAAAAEEPGAEGGRRRVGRAKPQRRSGEESGSPTHMEHINGVVQNALKKIGGFHHGSPRPRGRRPPPPGSRSRSHRGAPRSPTPPHELGGRRAAGRPAQGEDPEHQPERGTGLTKTNGLGAATPRRTARSPPPRRRPSAPPRPAAPPGSRGGPPSPSSSSSPASRSRRRPGQSPLTRGPEAKSPISRT